MIGKGFCLFQRLAIGQLGVEDWHCREDDFRIFKSVFR